MSEDARSADTFDASTTTTAAPNLSLLPEEGGAAPTPSTSSSAKGGGGAEEKEEEAGDTSEWWEPFFCRGTVPSGKFKTAGYDGDDSGSDDEQEASRDEFQRCDLCGCRALSRGCLVLLCCQEPRRSKTFTDAAASESGDVVRGSRQPTSTPNRPEVERGALV